MINSKPAKSEPLYLYARGDMACFSSAEFSVDKPSYPVMPFSAAYGLLCGVLNKSAFRWEIERIYVLSPIQYTTIMRNETLEKATVQYRMIFLRNPEYVIQARIVMDQETETDNIPKFVAMFHRYLAQGRLFKPVFLGMRECMAFLSEPPTDWRDRAQNANPQQGPILPRMPVMIKYKGYRPVEPIMSDYSFDMDTGSYAPSSRGQR